MDEEKLKKIFAVVNQKTTEKNNKIKEQESEIETLRKQLAKINEIFRGKIIFLGLV